MTTSPLHSSRFVEHTIDPRLLTPAPEQTRIQERQAGCMGLVAFVVVLFASLSSQ